MATSPLATGLFGAQNLYNAYFTTSPVSRLSFLRGDNALLHKASQHPAAKYLCMQDLHALRRAGHIAYASYDQVRPIIGEPFSQSEAARIDSFDSSIQQPPALVFLGLDIETKADAAADISEYKGIPYFALDVTGQPAAHLANITTDGAAFPPTRIDLTLGWAESSIYSQARSYLDWNARSRFCGSCGSRQLSVQGGTKVICPPKDKGVERAPCPTRTGLHNTSYPRTDPTLITAPVSADGKRVLLGRGKTWPDNYWSCIGGFIEPAESMETATRREVYEESGVRVGPVVIHSSQAWPFPSTMLVGTIGQCASRADETVTYPEQELAEARWFEYPEVEEALDHGHALWETPPRGWTGLRLPSDKLMAHRTLRGVLRLFGRMA